MHERRWPDRTTGTLSGSFWQFGCRKQEGVTSYLRMDSKPRRPCRLPEAPRLPSQATNGLRSSYLLTRHVLQADTEPLMFAPCALVPASQQCAAEVMAYYWTDLGIILKWACWEAELCHSTSMYTGWQASVWPEGHQTSLCACVGALTVIPGSRTPASWQHSTAMHCNACELTADRGGCPRG